LDGGQFAPAMRAFREMGVRGGARGRLGQAFRVIAQGFGI
jgi:hypothetical protein